MTSKLTRDRLAEIAQFGFSSAITPANDFEIKELARMALAAMDSKPVFFIEVEGDDWINAGRIEGKNRQDLGLLPDGINYLYAAPQPLTDAEREELQERRKAAMDGEPVAYIDKQWTLVYYIPPMSMGLKIGDKLYRHAQPAPVVVGEPVAKKVACWSCQNEVEISAIGDCDGYCPNCNSPIHLDEEPYTAPQSAPDRDQVRREHAEWSQATFGNVGPIGPLKHLSKEALEAAEQPGDLSEWADMQFLLWDAQRRAGITDDQITQAMIDKLAVNKQREWPEPKDGEPRLHIKEQPAPVVPEEKPIPNTLSMYAVDAVAAIAEVKGWNACRAAMLQAEPVCTCPSGDGSLRWPCPVHPGNSPAIPDAARDALEKALTAMEFMGDTLNNLDAVCSEDVEFVTPAFDAVRRVLAAAPQEVQGE